MSCKSENGCPVCENEAGNIVLDQRETIPTLQNVALANRTEAVSFPTGALKMMWCGVCSFVWNADFDPSKISYDAGYNNDVTYSGYYVAHLEAMADRIINSVPAGESIHYVEIGCGEGDFLRLVVERAQGRCVSATGFDPSFTKQDALPEGAVVHTTFFGDEQLALVPEAANVICSRHTIEHVADVQAFVQALCAPVTTPERTLFVETPNANWILQNAAFQDLFYEHCSIYTPESMALALGQHGLEAQTIPVYGGQYMWTEGRLAVDVAADEVEVTADLAQKYVDDSSVLLRDWGRFIEKQSETGPVAIWGAASKGVTFSLLLSRRDGAQIACAIDLNEVKQGCFLPLSGAPVVTPQDAMDLGVQSVIIMNPNYRDEVLKMANDMNWMPTFVTLNTET
jgi:hypothetical protein